MAEQVPLTVLTTLENLLAPGRRTRLSPFVESAQYQVLFGKSPTAKGWNESREAILKASATRVKQLADRWVKHFQAGNPFTEQDYDDDVFLGAYLAHYFPVNVCKLQIVMLDLLRDGLLPPALNVLDIGVGTGATVVAVMDFMLTLTTACLLHNVDVPVERISYVGMDRTPGCLDYSERVAKAYGAAIECRLNWLRSRGGETTSTGATAEAYSLVLASAEAARWLHNDVGKGVPDIDPQPNFAVLSNVWSELSEARQATVHEQLLRMDPGSTAVIIEPGETKRTFPLMAWRKRFVNQSHGFVSVAPCGQEFGTKMDGPCESCWCVRREAMHESALLKGFRAAVGDRVAGNQRKKFDEFENTLLSWSYVVLRRAELLDIDTGGTGDVLDGQALARLSKEPETEIRARYIGSFRNKLPDESGPDGLVVDTQGGTWVQYLKLCPGRTGTERLAIARTAGTEVPPLRFGDWISVSGVGVRSYGDGRVARELIPGTATRIESRYPATRSAFLRSYEGTAMEAIDEMAYRLFGFEAMHAFQHRILARVMVGGDILAIAATGGGKSECFILPAILLPGVTIVVSPLRSLMADQYDQRLCERFGLSDVSTYINSDWSLRGNYQRGVWHEYW